MKAEVMQLFQTLVSGNLEQVGTLADFVGVGGKIRFNDSNFNDPDKALMLDISRADGIKGRLFASQNVGEAIRAKRLSVPQLLGLRVIEAKTKEGKPTLKLVGWESNGSELEVKSLEVSKAPTATIKSIASLEDLGI